MPSNAAPDPGPLLVFFHGGGFYYGSLDSHDATCRLLAERAPDLGVDRLARIVDVIITESLGAAADPVVGEP